jgi:signal transduction histidine kinase
MSGADRGAVNALRDLAGEPGGHAATPLDRADREDAIEAWLSGHGISGVPPETLAESRLTIEELERFAGTVAPAVLGAAVKYVAASGRVRRSVAEINAAASRIYKLVDAVKGFVHLDQNVSPKPVDVERALSDTLTVLRSKARSKSVEVTLDLGSHLPVVEGYAGELNQVWANLVDNAIDASPGGHVTVKASGEHDHLVVRVIDGGPGIPAELARRIFDPFFTTKPIGEGTGLGLDIARRIVRRHRGEIDFTTGPGGTEFRVSLPAARPST